MRKLISKHQTTNITVDEILASEGVPVPPIVRVCPEFGEHQILSWRKQIRTDSTGFFYYWVGLHSFRTEKVGDYAKSIGGLRGYLERIITEDNEEIYVFETTVDLYKWLGKNYGGMKDDDI